MNCEEYWMDIQTIGQFPRVSTEDRDRVVSVFEFRICSLLVSQQIFSFLYSTVQKSAVQYSYFFYKIIAVMIDIDSSWECIAVYGPVQYSTVQYSTVQYITTVISGSRHYRPAPSTDWWLVERAWRSLEACCCCCCCCCCWHDSTDWWVLEGWRAWRSLEASTNQTTPSCLAHPDTQHGRIMRIYYAFLQQKWRAGVKET